MIVWICTDMEGVAGLDQWEQCGNPDDNAPAYLYGRDQLTADTNAAIAGCFDAGATEVRVLDGHGRNRLKGFTNALDPRAVKVGVAQRSPIRWEGMDESVHAVAMVGQHAMAGTLNGFLDHTQRSKVICRVTLNGQEIGEMSQCALYAGSFGVPLVYVSGDEALCAEARRLYPHVATTPTKQGTGWATCTLYPVDKVRSNIRKDIAQALAATDKKDALDLASPSEVTIEWAWSELADEMAARPGVRRPHARTTSWTMTDQRDIYTWPST
jgi:D-amino peptidase